MQMVACEIKRWGPTGLEDENGMCVLAPNVINQYIFLILWWSLGESFKNHPNFRKNTSFNEKDVSSTL